MASALTFSNKLRYNAEMTKLKVSETLSDYFKSLKQFVERPWYPPLLALLSILDIFIVVIPTDALLLSSAMFKPRRWFALGFFTALGSTLGSFLLSALVEVYGLPWILHIYPGLNQTQTWLWTSQFLTQFGLSIVFIVALTPLMQQPMVILASLALMPWWQMIPAIFGGRLIKCLVFSYIGSHAPELLRLKRP